MPPRQNSYQTVPDVKNEGSPLVGSDYPPQRRRRRCNIWIPLAFVLFFGSIIGAILVVFLHPKPNLEAEIAAAQSQVHVDKDGIYTVSYPDEVPSDMTFAELANRMLPPWYEALLMATDDGLDPDKMEPDNVAYTRKVFLMTRSLLDAFAPVYPQYSLWKKLRKVIDKGYEKIGKLQDLDHSGIDYDDELLQDRMDDVLDWKLDFALFQQEHHVRLFVYRGANPNQCTKQKSSHLFWYQLEKLPCGRDHAKAVVQELGKIQLTRAVTYWQTIQNYDTVLPLEREEEFHNLRKELRIFLDEYNMFGDLMLDDPDEDELDTLFDAQTKLGELNDAWTARQIYVTHGTHLKQQKELSSKIDDMWEDFQDWADKHDLAKVIQSQLDMLS